MLLSLVLCFSTYQAFLVAATAYYSDTGDETNNCEYHKFITAGLTLLSALTFLIGEVFLLVYALSLAMNAQPKSNAPPGSHANCTMAHMLFAIFATTPYVFAMTVID
jgi:hypothetical protein